MNCKQGDLAIIIKSPLQQNLDKIVSVSSYQGKHSQLGDIWRVTAKSSSLVTEMGITCSACDVPDDWLRPIRDPGEDAKDETLSWLPSPTLETA